MYCLPCTREVEEILAEAIRNLVDDVVPLVVLDGVGLEVAMSSATVVSEPEKHVNFATALVAVEASAATQQSL